MHKVSTDKKGKAFLLGNEAIVRGALEAGVQFTSTYPGTPASEIGDTFAKIAKETGVYFEYSTNEKVAFEAGAGAALSGLRTMVAFKHFGLNVAFDSIAPIAYVGTDGGLVIAFADDPSCWSSVQSEQDSRCFAKIANMPMIEPSNSQECIDFVKIAFDMSEKHKIPVFVRLTTRVSHTRAIVELGDIVKGERKANFKKGFENYNNFKPKIIQLHEDMLKKLNAIMEETCEDDKLNPIINDSDSDIGIITSGISFNYVMDAMEELGVSMPVLKIGTTNPLPKKRIAQLLKKLKSVLIVEELEPFLEEHVMAIAKNANPNVNVIGKIEKDNCEKLFPIGGEYTPELVSKAMSKLTGKEQKFDYDAHVKEFENIEIARRFPVLCPGCPHRSTFYAVKNAAGKDTVMGGDIGCYMLGVFPPFETVDFLIAMGAGAGITHGIRKASEKFGDGRKAIAFIGDSTFFHSGMPELVNMVFNKSNVLLIVLDNRITAMTGHQPNPGTGKTGMADPSNELKIDEIARACGVKNVKVIDPFNMKEMESTVKEFLGKDGVSVIVAKRECYLIDYKKRKKGGVKVPVFEVTEKLTDEETKVLKEFSCPAYRKDENGDLEIDKSMCWGCAVCPQLAKGKIKPKKESE